MTASKPKPEEKDDMALITRIARLFTADFHAVLDRLEEPDVLLKQAIREMEEELARCEQRSVELERERTQLARKEHEVEALIARLDSELDLCFAEEKPELARALVKRKLVQSHLERAVRTQRAEVEQALETVRGRLGENRERLSDLRQKAELVSDAAKPSATESGAALEPAVTEADVDVAFLKEQQRRRKP
jgi:phage shock protein A